MSVFLSPEEQAQLREAWLALQAARLESPRGFSSSRLPELIAEVAPLAADDKLRPHVVRLLTATDEVLASAQKREETRREGLVATMVTVLNG
jgi:hypothetical protein